MAWQVVLPTLLLLATTSAVAGDPIRLAFPAVRPPIDAMRRGGHLEVDQDFAPDRLHRVPAACSGLVAATDASAVIVEYQGEAADGIEVVHQLEVPDRDILTIDLEYADSAADLDVFLFEGDQIVGVSNIAAAGLSERIVTPVNGGRYFIGISAVRGASAYTLSTSLSESTSLSCEPMREIGFSPSAPFPAFDQLGTATTLRRRAVARPVRPASCTFDVSPLSQSVAQAAGILTINVTAQPGCDWRASSNATWLRVLWGGLAYGNGSAGFSVAANTGGFSRTGTVTVAGKTITVTQTGPCTYSVSPTNPQIPSSGGPNTISVTAGVGCDWSASVAAAAPWITITSGQSGSGNGAVAYSVAANPATSSRTGTMTVAGKTVTVKQAADLASCTYALAYTSKTLSWCGGQRSVAVTTQGECPWTASKDASWITLGGSNRTGSGSLFYLLDRNSGGSRQATITVAGTPVAIAQNGRTSGGTNEGVWTGMTAANRNVQLCVAENALQDALVTVRLSFPTFSCTGPLTITDPVPINSGTFSGLFTFPGSTISTTVRGTFSSSTAMSGSHDGYSGSFLILCGSTFSLGTGSGILSSGTYTATKQP
jgi:hypothetical protein